MDFPDKKYSVIYADPPWPYRFPVTRVAWSADYPTMTIEEIAALPVDRLAAEDSLLFMWIIFSQFDGALEVMRRWGFKYTTCGFAWVKTTKNNNGLFTGMGNWTRQNLELCLIGKRGTPVRKRRDIHSIVIDPIREHSRKPDEVRKRIELLMGDVPRIELFARESKPGWDCRGNEVEKFDSVFAGAEQVEQLRIL